MLNKDILIYIYNGLTQYDHALIGKIRQTCKLFSYYPKGVMKVTREEEAVRYKLLVDGGEIWHRKDGPAIELASGSKEWLLHGEWHRVDGPAIELASGYKEWFAHGKLHREDGPAIEWANGSKEWWVHGKLHREDGPAVEWANGTKEWWIRDKKYSESAFEIARRQSGC